MKGDITVKTTYTVADKTWLHEEEALNYAHFLNRRREVVEFLSEYFWIFDDDDHKKGVKSLRSYSTSFEDLATKQLLAGALIKHPEVFRQALDIVDGK